MAGEGVGAEALAEVAQAARAGWQAASMGWRQ